MSYDTGYSTAATGKADGKKPQVQEGRNGPVGPIPYFGRTAGAPKSLSSQDTGVIDYPTGSAAEEIGG